MHETENCRIARRNESAALNITCASTTGAIPEGKFRCIRLTPNRLVSEALNILYLQTVFCAETDLRSQKKNQKGERESTTSEQIQNSFKSSKFKILKKILNTLEFENYLLINSYKINICKDIIYENFILRT